MGSGVEGLGLRGVVVPFDFGGDGLGVWDSAGRGLVVWGLGFRVVLLLC